MRSLRLFLLALIFAAPLPLIAGDKTEPMKWTEHECLQTPEIAEADWQPRGKGSKVEVTAKGLLLPGNSRMASRFLLSDGGRIKFVYTTNNRNAIVRLCGKELKAKAPNKGSILQVFDIVRNGRTVVWGVSMVDGKGRLIGKPLRSDAIRIDEAEVNKPAQVVFASEPVTGRGDSNSVGDIRFKSITVTGTVVPAPPEKSKSKK